SGATGSWRGTWAGFTYERFAHHLVNLPGRARARPARSRRNPARPEARPSSGSGRSLVKKGTFRWRKLVPGCRSRTTGHGSRQEHEDYNWPYLSRLPDRSAPRRDRERDEQQCDLYLYLLS